MINAANLAGEFMDKAIVELAKANDENSADPLEAAWLAAQGAYQALLSMRPREMNVTQSRQAGGGGGGGGGPATPNQVGFGSVTLSWMPPTENADGSVLTDLVGYKVYYGTTIDSMNTIETINNPAITVYIVENLHAGSWFFKVTAFDTAGNESDDSNTATKEVQP